MSKKEKIEIKNKIDAIIFAMLLLSDCIDKAKYVVAVDLIEKDVLGMYIQKLEEHLSNLEDIRAEYQKRLSQ